MFRRLMLESLETRRVLAGNVTATIVEGELRIVGDDAANSIQVHQVAGADGSGRTFVIEGKPFAGNYDAQGQPIASGPATKINGGLQAVSRTTSQDTLRIYMGKGNDVVDLGTANATGNARTLVVRMADGRDFVDIQRMNIYGAAQPLTIRTGNDDDFMADTVKLETVKVVHQGLEILTGSGNDNVVLEDVSVAAFTEIDLGKGADHLDGYAVIGDSGLIRGGSSDHRDVVALSDTQFAWLTVQLGGGNDLLNLRERVKTINRLTVDGGAGTDELRVGEQVTWDKITKISFEVNS